MVAAADYLYAALMKERTETALIVLRCFFFRYFFTSDVFFFFLPNLCHLFHLFIIKKKLEKSQD
jgi:hypothetical protein